VKEMRDFVNLTKSVLYFQFSEDRSPLWHGEWSFLSSLF